MADDEEEYEAEAEEDRREEKQHRGLKPRSKHGSEHDLAHEVKELTEAEQAMLAAKKRHEDEEAVKLAEYEEQRRIQREKEEEELRLLKEKQERRKVEREEEERQMAERKREDEERRRQEEEERKRKSEEEKRKKEEDKKKRQQMMSVLNTGEVGKPNYTVEKKDKDTEKFDKFGNIVKAKAEMGLTKEQQEELKKKVLVDIIKPLSLDGMDSQTLRTKIKELHQRICRLEADQYDLGKRHERQEYDLKELNERQRQINRNKAQKKGLDPDAVNSRFPPKVAVFSKYDRQIDRRSFHERKALYDVTNAHPHFPNVPPPEAPMLKEFSRTSKEQESDREAAFNKSAYNEEAEVEEAEEEEEEEEEEE